MSRLHIHIAVDDMETNIAFYSAMFGTEPSVNKPDYAKWELEDPDVNFAVSTRADKPGLDHVGLQAKDETELKTIRLRLEAAGIKGMAQEGTTCCYAKSDKYWTIDPQGIAWEGFHTLESAAVYGERTEAEQRAGSCCTPNLSNCC